MEAEVPEVAAPVVEARVAMVAVARVVAALDEAMKEMAATEAETPWEAAA
jgi:hypothetical protein